MTVRKHNNGNWVADVTIGKRLDGKRDRHQPQFRTKAEALKEERRLNLLKESQRGKSYGGILLGEFLDGYFWPQKKNLRPSTVRGYKRDIKLRLKPAFENTPIDDIDRYAIQRMIDGCPTKKAATNAKDTLSSILGLALEMGIIQVNPAGFRNYSYPPATRRDPAAMGVWLESFDEIKRFIKWAHSKAPGSAEERMCVLGLAFGLRKGEVLGLDGCAISLEGRYVEIYQSYTQGEKGAELTPPKTDNAYRKVPMPIWAYEVISEWDLDDGPVVLDRNGSRMSPVNACDRVAAFVKDAKYDDGTPVPRVTQFSMRHSFGTSCISSGVEVTKLRDWMGHVDQSVTMRYVKHANDNMMADALLLDELTNDSE